MSENRNKERNIYTIIRTFFVALPSIIKEFSVFLAALAVFIPLMLGIIQYSETRQQESDKYFREIIPGLSDTDPEKRLAAATTISTFIKQKDNHYEQAIDILVNRLSIEKNYDVIMAIQGSLQKVDEKHYTYLIDRLSYINRNVFMKTTISEIQYENASKAIDFFEEKTIKKEFVSKQYDYNTDKSILDTMIKEYQIEMKNYIDSYRNKTPEEVKLHIISISDVMADLLKKRNINIFNKYSDGKITFYYNYLYKTLLINLNLSNINIDRSTFEATRLNGTKFDNSSITYSNIESSYLNDTKFDNSSIIYSNIELSDLTGTSFIECIIKESLFYNNDIMKKTIFKSATIENTFFIASDIEGADFRGVKGLKPIYFYKAKNWDKAKFDEFFFTQLKQEMPKITDADFEDYIKQNLTQQDRQEDLLNLIKKIDKNGNRIK